MTNRTTRAMIFFVVAIAMVGKSTAQTEGKAAGPEKSATKPSPPSLQEVLRDGKNVIVIPFKNFNQLDRPEGVFLPGADGERVRKEIESEKPTRTTGVQNVSIVGELGEVWATLDVVIEARVDDPRGGELALQLGEAQCSQIELRYRDLQQDASVPAAYIEPAPIVKPDPLGPYLLKLDRAGAYTAKLKLFLEIDRGPLERQLFLTLPSSPVKKIRLTESAVRPGVRIEGARLLPKDREIPTEDAGKTMTPRLNQDDSLSVRWRVVSDPTSANAKELNYKVIGRHALRGRKFESTTEITVTSAKERNEWLLVLPAGENYIRAQLLLPDGRSHRVTGSVVSNAPEGQRVQIKTADQIAGTVILNVVHERTLPNIPADGITLELREIEIPGATADLVRARLLTSKGDDIRVTPTPKPEQGIMPIANERVEDETPASMPFQTFQFADAKSVLPIRIDRVQPVLAESGSNMEMVVRADVVDLNLNYRLNVRQGQVETLRIVMPANVTDVATMVDGRTTEATWLAEPVEGEAGKGGRILQVRLGDRQAGDLRINLRGKLPILRGKDNEILIPYLASLPDATATVQLIKSPVVSLFLLPDRLRQLDVQPTSKTVATSDASQNRPWVTLRSRGAGAKFACRVELAPAKISARVEHRMHMVDANLHVETVVRWSNPSVPIREVMLEIPADANEITVLGDRLAVPANGLLVGTGKITLPLAFPSEFVDATIRYTVLPTAGEEAFSQRASLVVPSADVYSLFGCQLRGLQGAQPRFPDWQRLSPDRWKLGAPEADVSPIDLLAESTGPRRDFQWKNPPKTFVAEAVVSRQAYSEVWSAGRRLGRLYAVLERQHGTTISLEIPSKMIVGQVLVNGKVSTIDTAGPDSLAAGNLGLLVVPLPADDDKPVSLELSYEAAGPQPALFAGPTLSLPRFSENVAVNRRMFRLHTPGDWLAIFVGNDIDGAWPNPLQIGSNLPANLEGVGRSDAELRKFLVEGLGEVTFADSPAEKPTGRAWTFADWGDAGGIHIWLVRETSWVLFMSGVGLGLAMLIGRVIKQWSLQVFAGLAVTLALLYLFAPYWLAWIWIGARWGLVAGGIMGAIYGARQFRAAWRRKRMLRLARLALRVPEPAGISFVRPASSLTTRGSSFTGDAPPKRGSSFDSFGTTIEPGARQ